MGHSVNSSGIRDFEADHAHIDAVIGHLAGVTNPVDEKKQLMDIYCLIIAHIQFRNDFIGQRMSDEAREQDAVFLRNVRGKIRQRNEGLLSIRQLVSDLRHMLMVHATQSENRPKDVSWPVFQEKRGLADAEIKK